MWYNWANLFCRILTNAKLDTLLTDQEHINCRLDSGLHNDLLACELKKLQETSKKNQVFNHLENEHLSLNKVYFRKKILKNQMPQIKQTEDHFKISHCVIKRLENSVVHAIDNIQLDK
jgi:hypothetical protein